MSEGGSAGELATYVFCPVCQEVVSEAAVDGEVQACGQCITKATMKREHAESREKARKVFREMIAGSRPDAILAPHISEVCAGVVRELGGLERFCEELVEDYRDARERSPGSATVILFGETILRLVRDSSTLRESAPDAVNLTEEELAGEVLALFERVVRDKGLDSIEQGLAGLLLGTDTGKPTEVEANGAEGSEATD